MAGYYDIVKKQMKEQFKKYEAIALYGTGIWAGWILDFAEEMQIEKKLAVVLDNDASDMIGQLFRGRRVEKLSEVLDKVDAILISSAKFWDPICERIEKVLEENGREIPIISVHADKFQIKRTQNIEDYREYVYYLEERKRNRSKNFVKITSDYFERKADDTKVIAWYLPQYYHMEINDKYHGRGFTEWTNSSQAVPLYVGHEQPHIPYDVGYYSLDNVETLKRQAELAKMYGVYGFGFHYYWFSGERTMEKPLFMLLEHPEIDLPFCIDWASENWTSVWDGGKYDVIFEQKIMEGDEERFVNDILPFFKDPRYIKIDGKPLLSIYSTRVFEKERFVEFVRNIRRLVQENGFPDLYILLTDYETYDVDVVEYGADALVEFQPNQLRRYCEKYEPEGYVYPYFCGDIFDLQGVIQRRDYMAKGASKKYFRSALVGFDNTARRTYNGAQIYHGASPQGLQRWLVDIMRESKEIHTSQEDFVFVNSWNEWAEGSHLEPDVRNGYAYLEAVKKALYECRELDTSYVDRRLTQVLEKGLMPHIYILCIESMGDIVACEPLARIMREKAQGAKVTWIVKAQYADIVKYNPNIDEIKLVANLAEAEAYCNELKKEENAVIVDCHYNGRICSATHLVHSNLINPKIYDETYFNYGALLENFSLTAGLEKCSLAPIFHEKPGVENVLTGYRYVVFHCRSAERCKDWKADKWRKLTERLIAQGYYVAEIGLEPVIEYRDEHYVDCTKIHDVQQIAQIIKGADAFVGIDSVFAHIANCYSKDAVLIFGKYHDFDVIMPYTGCYAEKSEEVIVYASEGMAENVDVDVVYRRLMERLNEE